MARRSKYLFRVKGLNGAWVATPVNARMKSNCASCGCAPLAVRVVHKANPDPFPKSTVYCLDCASAAAVAEADTVISAATVARIAVIDAIHKARHD